MRNQWSDYLETFRKQLSKISDGETHESIAMRLDEKYGQWGAGKFSKINTGKQKPNIEDLLQIASLYDCSIDYLLGMTDEQPRNKKKLTFRDLAEMLIQIDEAFRPSLATDKEGNPAICFDKPMDKYKTIVRSYDAFFDCVQSANEDGNHISGYSSLKAFLEKYNKHKDLFLSGAIDREAWDVLINAFLQKVPEDPAPYPIAMGEPRIDYDFNDQIRMKMSEEEISRAIEELKNVDESEVNQRGYTQRHPESVFCAYREDDDGPQITVEEDKPAPAKKTKKKTK